MVACRRVSAAVAPCTGGGDVVNDLPGSPWGRADTVRGFAQSPPNATLLRFAEHEFRRCGGTPRALDIGCGAARNAVPLARGGWRLVCVDTSRQMLESAATRADAEGLADRIACVRATMSDMPLRDASCDLIVAHGIWNLARSGAEFRAALAEAARVARPAAGLFVFTFSRHTLPPDAVPIAGEQYVFTQFSGEPQCFLTADDLVSELRAAGFAADPAVPLTEHNRRTGAIVAASGPVIYEGGFRRVSARKPLPHG
jgi:SAM-dependent methyltransferase